MLNSLNEIVKIPHLNQLLLLLQQLDQLLEEAIATAQAAYGAETPTNPYRGIHVDEEEVERLLTREPGETVLQGKEKKLQQFPSDVVVEGSHLAWLMQTFGLSHFDIDIIAIALAPELDLRYERLYAYLQDDVTRKRPTVDLALNLLCPDAIAKLLRRDRFAPEAPLIRHGLLHLLSDSNHLQPPLLAQYLKLDEQVIRLLLGQKGLDGRLVSFCQLTTCPTVCFEHLPLNGEIKQALVALVVEDWEARKPLRLYFQGGDRSGKRLTALALARVLQVPLLTADLAGIMEAKADFEPTLKLILREASFQNALLYLEGVEAIHSTDRPGLYQCLLKNIAENQLITILAGVAPWVNMTSKPLGIVTVSFPLPDFARRQQYWQQHLKGAGVSLDGLDLDGLSDRFRLSYDQIADAVATACNTARWHGAGEQGSRGAGEQGDINPSLTDFFVAARAQSGHDLRTLARQIQPQYSWEDMVLPVNQKTLLREICNQVKYQHLVWQQWGFANKQSLGKGLNVMFSGPPGVGKTMAAEIIAGELQLDLYKIDLSQVVSKYIGETEKNLHRIFEAATNANAILLFDEADSLFGKRTEVKDAHDRYANLEIGYLLQKMEEYEGVTILTTNFRSNMDDAFVRRLRFIVEFPFPNYKQRLLIWQKIFPPSANCSSDLDFDLLARELEITGANIRNIALTAAFLAADDDGGQIGMVHLVRAVHREYQKMGKILKDIDLTI